MRVAGILAAYMLAFSGVVESAVRASAHAQRRLPRLHRRAPAGRGWGVSQARRICRRGVRRQPRQQQHRRQLDAARIQPAFERFHGVGRLRRGRAANRRHRRRGGSRVLGHAARRDPAVAACQRAAAVRRPHAAWCRRPGAVRASPARPPPPPPPPPPAPPPPSQRAPTPAAAPPPPAALAGASGPWQVSIHPVACLATRLHGERSCQRRDYGHGRACRRR
mmetsp:Transcript_20706/g.61810  ORF Transcript_20706/g.61810 Transcript_20706/m.61810 type:complete len:221 (-) Transcript_20706:1211-1873(-)